MLKLALTAMNEMPFDSFVIKTKCLEATFYFIWKYISQPHVSNSAFLGTFSHLNLTTLVT